tara:strand:- start:186 stop:824 length:639 start_codon:yes stop_codon:yes gene_type:complete
MNTKKRIDGDYYIETINATDMVHIASNTEIDGNLTVNGNVTYINTEQLDVKDPFVMVNMSNTATYASNAGLLTHKTATTFAGIRYNTNDNKWELSTSTGTTGETGTWSEIGTAAAGAVAGANTQVQFNASGSFGASSNFTFTDTSQLNVTGNINLTTGLQLADSAVPGAVTDTTVLHGGVAGSGGTGVYFVDGTTTDELVSKSKAIVFGIIF